MSTTTSYRINLAQRRLEQANTEKQKLLLELTEVTNRESQQNEHNKRLKRKTLLLTKVHVIT